MGCDILAPMNPQRGLRRLYAVLTFAWIIALLVILPSYRWRFWVAPIDDSYATRVKESKAMGSLPAGYILNHTLEWTKQHQIEEQALDAAIKRYGGTPANVQPPIDYDALASTPNRFGDMPVDPVRVSPTTGDRWQQAAQDDAWKIWKEEDHSQPPPLRVQKGLWLATAFFGPPTVGYALVFLVIPWI